MSDEIKVIRRFIAQLKKSDQDIENEDKKYFEIRNTLRKYIHDFIINNPSSSATFNVEDLLWRYVYYKLICQYREKIALYNKSQSGYDPRYDLYRRKLSQFVEESMSEYASLLHRVDETPVESGQETLRLDTRYCCNLYLGDLCRYKLSGSRDEGETGSSLWTRAEEYYQTARQIDPYRGNAYSQLGIAAQCYHTRYAIAMYRYIQARESGKSFHQGEKNLEALYRTLETHFKDESFIDTESIESMSISSSSERDRYLQRFLNRYAYAMVLIARDELGNHLPDFEVFVSRLQVELPILIRKSALDRVHGIIFAVLAIFHCAKSGSGSEATTKGAELLLFKLAGTFAKVFNDQSFSDIVDSSNQNRIDVLAVLCVILEWIKLDFERTGKFRFHTESPVFNDFWKIMSRLCEKCTVLAQKIPTRHGFVLWEEVELSGFKLLEYNALVPSMDENNMSNIIRARKVLRFLLWYSTEIQPLKFVVTDTLQNILNPKVDVSGGEWQWSSNNIRDQQEFNRDEEEDEDSEEVILLEPKQPCDGVKQTTLNAFNISSVSLEDDGGLPMEAINHVLLGADGLESLNLESETTSEYPSSINGISNVWNSNFTNETSTNFSLAAQNRVPPGF